MITPESKTILVKLPLFSQHANFKEKSEMMQIIESESFIKSFLYYNTNEEIYKRREENRFRKDFFFL